MTVKARIDLKNGCWIEAEADTVKETVRQIAGMQEVYRYHKCGHCESQDLAFEYRVSGEDHAFHSLKCLKCGYQMDFGQHKKGGTLFVKTDWYHWERNRQSGQPPQGKQEEKPEW